MKNVFKDKLNVKMNCWYKNAQENIVSLVRKNQFGDFAENEFLDLIHMMQNECGLKKWAYQKEMDALLNQGLIDKNEWNELSEINITIYAKLVSRIKLELIKE